MHGGGQSSSGPTYYTILALGITIVFFGSNFVPVKNIEIKNYAFFQWVMCNAILLTALPWCLVQQREVELHPIALLGGIAWCCGNYLCPMILDRLGLGVGSLLWGTVEMFTAWLSGTFGILGVERQIIKYPWLNFLGVMIVVAGGIVLSQVSSEGTNTSRTATPLFSSLPASPIPLEQQPLSRNQSDDDPSNSAQNINNEEMKRELSRSQSPSSAPIIYQNNPLLQLHTRLMAGKDRYSDGTSERCVEMGSTTGIAMREQQHTQSRKYHSVNHSPHSASDQEDHFDGNNYRDETHSATNNTHKALIATHISTPTQMSPPVGDSPSQTPPSNQEHKEHCNSHSQVLYPAPHPSLSPIMSSTFSVIAPFHARLLQQEESPQTTNLVPRTTQQRNPSTDGSCTPTQHDIVELITPVSLTNREEHKSNSMSPLPTTTFEPSKTASGLGILGLRPFEEGILLALIAGLLFGISFNPTQYLVDQSDGRLTAGTLIVSHYAGICYTSYVLYIGSIVSEKLSYRNKGSSHNHILQQQEELEGNASTSDFSVSFIDPDCIIPAVLAGLMWGVGAIAWFVAAETLPISVTFPLISAGPNIVTMCWSILYFQEVQRFKDRCLLSIALTLLAVGLFCVWYSNL